MSTAADIPKDLIDALRKAASIVVLTGAGASAESGVPTFRDALTGLWSKFRPEELATPGAFAADPAKVTRWYDERRVMAANCRPNPGHLALAQLQSLCEKRSTTFRLITQNIDRLHQRAGSKHVIELHGNLFTWRCAVCGAESEETGPAFSEFPPRCHCGGNRRPGVVWFGENLDEGALALARHDAERSDLFVSIGTSAVVYPAAGLIEMAVSKGAGFLEINTDETPLTRLARWSIRQPSAVALPRIVAMLERDDRDVTAAG